MKRRKRTFVVLALAILAAALPARAWWPQGHSIIAEAAVRSLPTDVPAFFREGYGLVAHCAQDPDLFKSRDTPQVNDAEDPEHYLDYELLKGQPLPPTRSAYLKLLASSGLEAKKVGTVPYSIAEWTQKLEISLAEHRRWPENPHVRTKSLVYAGILAHYAGDLCMPLHTTVDYDGRAKPDGTSTHTGIHARVDSIIEKLELKPEELAAGQKIEAVPELMPAILREIEGSRALIDRTYALESQFPPREGPWTPSPEARAFGTERGREATRFLASLYLTAWKDSATVKLPPWLVREGAPRR